MASTQTSKNLIWAKGRGRGKRANQPFAPSRRPGEKAPEKRSLPAAPAVDNSRAENRETVTQEAPKTTSDVQSLICKGQKYLAKYNYKANPQSPLGQEVSLTQGEHVNAVEKHKDNDMWWRVTKSSGESGYVPAKYLYKVEEKITTLPWLANKQIEAEKDCPPPGVRGPPKPYVSAYNKPEKEEIQKKQYYCEICARDFNGPRPYSTHMVSKAHKLELELAEERERDAALNS